MKNALLNNIEKAVDAKVPKPLKPIYQRAVVAGLKVMHSPQTHDMMLKQLQGEGDIAQKVGQGAAKLVVLLYAQFKKQIPVTALALAGQALVLEALDFLEQAGVVQVDNAVVDEATKEYGAAVLQLFGVTPEKLQQMGVQLGAKVGKPVTPPLPTSPQQPAPQQPAGLIGNAMEQQGA